MYGCDSWIIKKAECHQFKRIDAFELWCWWRLLQVPWSSGRSNQSILKETSLGKSWKDWCWGWNSNSLATSCKELTHWKRLWCWEGLGAGGDDEDRRWDGWMTSPTRCTWIWVNSGSWWWTGRPGRAAIHKVTKSRTRLSEWTELNWTEWLGAVGLHRHQPGERVYKGGKRTPRRNWTVRWTGSVQTTASLSAPTTSECVAFLPVCALLLLPEPVQGGQTCSTSCLSLYI